MNRHDLQRFGAVMASLCEFYEKELSKMTISDYFEALSDYPIEHVEHAAREAKKTCEWLPKPVRLIAAIEGSGETKALIMTRNAHEAWAIAWGHVTSGKWRNGGTGIVEIDATIRLMGGWTRMGAVLESEMPFREKEFIEKYTTGLKIAALPECDVLDQLGYKPKLIN